jgi:hypothetical protein
MNPAYINGPGGFVEVENDKISIGGKEMKKDRIYSTQVFALQDVYQVFLFSDGFQDQFGGPDNRKYMKKRFRNLLQGYAGLPMQEIGGGLEQEFNGWTDGGKFPQTDDVTVFGCSLAQFYKNKG